MALPFQDAFAGRRAVVVLSDLPVEGARPRLVAVRVAAQGSHQLLLRKEVPGHHREDEPSIVADIAPGLERRDQVRHHADASKLLDWHASSSEQCE
jgi:hypothetical protein